MSTEALFQPFTFKNITVPNRVVMAPMTRSFSPGGVPTDEVAAYYARRVTGGTGFLISEGTGVARPASVNGADIPLFHGERELAGWKKVIDDVHAVGGLMAPQLWHVGAMRSPYNNGASPDDYESPSGYYKAGKTYGKPMADADVADTIAAFGKAATDAKRLGFDAVELHGAHGYLIDQFFWVETNQRNDAFAGPSIRERSRFAADIIKSVRKAVGPDYPIIIRLSQWKQQNFESRLAETPDEMAEWLSTLVDAGADVLHCSQRRFWEPEFEGSDLNFAGWAKKLTGAPTITVGSVGLTGEFVAAYGGEASQPASLDELTRRLERGDFDLVAVGRALLQDPNWTNKIREERTSELQSFEASAFATLS